MSTSTNQSLPALVGALVGAAIAGGLLLAVANSEPAAGPTAPAPAAPPAVLELYFHSDGKTRCVDADSKPWQAYRCCPEGFGFAGFSVRAATGYLDAEGIVDRQLYRHVVCLQEQ